MSHASRVNAAGQDGRLLELRNGHVYRQLTWPNNISPEPIRKLQADGGHLLVQTANQRLLLEDGSTLPIARNQRKALDAALGQLHLV
ncbi:MAG: hypothetical protein ACOCZ8_00790 [Bacteroidota bacterium]